MNTKLPVLPSIVSNKQKLSDFIYDVMCDFIAKGKIVPGQRLREAEVAESLDVSRTPVREAFAILEMQHLLERDSTGAYLVATWDSQRLWEIASLRATLDGMAIRLASERMKPADYDYLKSVIMQMEAATIRKDYDALIDLDIQFHSYIWGVANHLLLREMLEGMKAQVRFFMYLTRPGDEETYSSTHQDLLNFLQDGDHSKLDQVIKDHILATAERAILRMGIE